VQTAPVGQRLPQAPQLFGSLATNAQPPLLHRTAPIPHMQFPAVHVPPAHERPHAPQLFGSLERSAQAVGHATSEPPQLHAPPVHVEPVGHTRSQRPQ
jgi:hypothetical protein